MPNELHNYERLAETNRFSADDPGPTEADVDAVRDALDNAFTVAGRYFPREADATFWRRVEHARRADTEAMRDRIEERHAADALILPDAARRADALAALADLTVGRAVLAWRAYARGPAPRHEVIEAAHGRAARALRARAESLVVDDARRDEALSHAGLAVVRAWAARAEGAGAVRAANGRAA